MAVNIIQVLTGYEGSIWFVGCCSRPKAKGNITVWGMSNKSYVARIPVNYCFVLAKQVTHTIYTYVYVLWIVIIVEPVLHVLVFTWSVQCIHVVIKTTIQQFNIHSCCYYLNTTCLYFVQNLCLYFIQNLCNRSFSWACQKILNILKQG